MKVKINALELKEALQMVSVTVSKRKLGADSQLILLRAIKDEDGEYLQAYSSDGIASTLVKTPCKVTDAGKIALDPAQLNKNLHYTPDDTPVEFAMDKSGNRLTAKFGTIKKAVYRVNAETEALETEVKALPITASESFEINASTFREILERTQPFLYRQDDKTHIQNVLLRTTFTGFEALASDMIVLVRVTCPDGNGAGLDESVMIPNRAIPALKKMLDKNRKLTMKVMVHRNAYGRANSMSIRTETVFYNTRVSDDQFPRTEPIFEKNVPATIVKIPAKDLHACLDECSSFAEHRYVTLTLRSNEIVIRAKGDFNEFEQALPAEVLTWPDGIAELTVGFDVNKLLSVSSTLRDETIQIGFTETRTMAVIDGETEDGKTTRFLVASALAKQHSKAA